jgi:hypothetical protein
LTSAAENYHATLEENRKLFNEVQELKGGYAKKKSIYFCMLILLLYDLLRGFILLIRKYQSLLPDKTFSS